MPSPEDRGRSSAYRPTSLDFINLPNPIQPAPPSQKHPLNGTPHLDKARLDTVSNPDLFRLVLDPNGERAAKRPRPPENPSLDLPKLPVRNNAKRLRIPPTLSGLYQPPPDAGLLPSISVDKPPSPHLRPSGQGTHNESQLTSLPAAHELVPNIPSTQLAANEPKKRQKKLTKRNKWTDEETENLLKGVARFGVGNWTKIWNCSDFHFNDRTALDLKDRFRVCFPDQSKIGKKKGHLESLQVATATTHDETTVKRALKGPAPERVEPATLEKLGITAPFTKSERRARHAYSVAEDESLLRGFKKHGKAWTAIRQDPELRLSGRQATDLRDRMRTRFPDEYARAGLAPRAKKPGAENHAWKPEEPSHVEAESNELSRSNAESKATTAQNAIPLPKVTETRKPQQQALFSLDDVYLGQLSEDEDDEDGPITLDRGILDWATDTARPLSVKPLRVLDANASLLPKPVQSRHVSDSASSQHPHNATVPALPSLAALLPENSSTEHLELPSLTEWWGPTDGRSGGSSYPTLEEILSHDL